MLLETNSTLGRVTELFDAYLKSTYPAFFGDESKYPTHRLKDSKIIHDNLWGTNRFSWIEMCVIDSPIFQRIRYIHQTGLAFLVYPSAHHSRFEHSLGVVTIASRIFDALFQRYPDHFKSITEQIFAGKDIAAVFEQLRAELRLACLIHDIGHSIHSHASEVVYGGLKLLDVATRELGEFAGEKKGAGEVLSFCISQTSAFRQFIQRVRSKIDSPELKGLTLNLDNVSLLIIGRSSHPLLQFMGNIVSGPIDADKLDYLVRDSSFAGLPLKYDLERFLHTIGLATSPIADQDQKLARIYNKAGWSIKPKEGDKYPVFDALQLRPPRQLISTIEQITICKFMLFSYIYHHKKVRAAEGMLIRLLLKVVGNWQNDKVGDDKILISFMNWKDDALTSPTFLSSEDAIVKDYAYRILNRLLPCLVFGFVTNNKSKAQSKLKAFSAKLAEPKLGELDPKRDAIDAFESALRKKLETELPELAGPDILLRTGMWLDVPKAPSFETTESLLIGEEALPLKVVFPIKPWVDGYEANRYYIRVFAFSEYIVEAQKAVKSALKEVVHLTSEELHNIETQEFFPS